MSKADFIKKYKDGEKYYSNIEKSVKELSDNYITYKNKPVYVPCFKTSKGYTEKDKEYPYLKAAACPWDRLKKDSKNWKTRSDSNIKKAFKTETVRFRENPTVARLQNHSLS